MEPIQEPRGPEQPRKSFNWSVVIASLIVTVPVAAAAGGVGGYLFGRKIVVTNSEGEESAFKQTIQVEESSATVDAVEKVSPAVVSIIGEGTQQDIFGFASESREAGSGFIITADGLVATNKHVVSSNDKKYKVVMSDGQSFPVTEIHRDPSFDFAVVKIQADNLPIVELGTSDRVKIGERVIAIGNAVGEFQNTVTAGVISARNRSIEASNGSFQTEQLEGLLQTDAAINPGNSGGPLINLSGQVVGVNTATDLGSENISFAIPIDDAKVAIESIIQTGEIERPILGVRYVNLTEELAQLNDIPSEHGAYIVAPEGNPAVVEGGPADQLGIKEGDIVLKINDEEIKPERSLAAIMRKFRPGDEVTVEWLTEENETKSGKVKLSSFPAEE